MSNTVYKKTLFCALLVEKGLFIRWHRDGKALSQHEHNDHNHTIKSMSCICILSLLGLSVTYFSHKHKNLRQLLFIKKYDFYLIKKKSCSEQFKKL